VTHEFDALAEFDALRARLKAEFPGPYTTTAPSRCLDCGSLLGNTSAVLCVVCAWHRDREDPEVDEVPEGYEAPYQPSTGSIFSGMVNIADVAQQLTEVTSQLAALRGAIEARFDSLDSDIVGLDEHLTEFQDATDDDFARIGDQLEALEPPEGYTVTITPGGVASGREFLAE